MSCRVSARAHKVGRTVAKATADQVAALRATGREVFDLYGSPFWLPPPHVLEAAAVAVRDPNVAHSQGLPRLRQAIADRLQRENGVAADPEREILVTNAGMHALAITFSALLDPGDEVLLYAPAFYFYGAIALAGGVPVYARTLQEHGWAWDAEALAAAVTPRTRLIIVNTPTNPTGYVASHADLQAVADIAQRHDLLVVSDEAYDHMLYDGARHLSIAALPGMRERTVSVYSFTKSYALKQWRVGFLVAPPDLLPHLRKVLEWNVLACNHLAQYAALAALEGPQDWVAEIGGRFERCRDLMVVGLRDGPGLSFVVPRGGPFVFLNVGELGLSGGAFARRLLEDYGVPVDPGDDFGSDCHVRVEFGGQDEVVREAARRIVHLAEVLHASAGERHGARDATGHTPRAGVGSSISASQAHRRG